MLHCWTEQTSAKCLHFCLLWLVTCSTWLETLEVNLLFVFSFLCLFGQKTNRQRLWCFDQHIFLELIQLVAVTTIVFVLPVNKGWASSRLRWTFCFQVPVQAVPLLFLPFRPERSPLPERPFCAKPGRGQRGRPGSSTVPQPAAEPSSGWGPPGGGFGSDPGRSPYSRCGGSTSFCRHW